jgi:hypothetical protein
VKSFWYSISTTAVFVGSMGRLAFLTRAGGRCALAAAAARS